MKRSLDWHLTIRLGLVIALAIGFSSAVWTPATGHAAGYRNAEALGKHLEDLARSHRKLMRVESIAKSLGKRDVWLVELGAGKDKERKTRPAMLVVAGIEGNDLAGCAAAVGWIERLVGQYEKNDQVRKLLDTTTLYVIARLNPDAAEAYFAKPTVERSVTGKPVDDDHDGMQDEDGPEDLDGDGQITWMRIEDPEGEYILDPADSRLLMEADPVKGEVGAWRLLTEGRDNDADEQWNEDGPGGVNLNRNFPFQYKWFAADSGIHQVSENETRALADFIVDHPQIGIVFTFGAADNLAKTPKGGPRPSGRKPATVIHEKDLPFYKQMGEIYRKTLGLGKELEADSQPGAFSDWMYFHRGRLSLAAQPWTPAMQLELEKTKEQKKDKKENTPDKPKTKDAPEDKPTSPGVSTDDTPTTQTAKTEDVSKKTPEKTDADKRNEAERAFLTWLDENAPERFVPWKEYDHPDFPGQRVEIGGFAPFAQTAPPEAILEEITTRHADFLTTLALRLPRIGIRKMESKHLGESVYEVEIRVENTGYLPTLLAHGEITREVHLTRIVLDLDDKAFLSGSRVLRLPTLAGSGGMVKMRYILHVPKREPIRVRVVSMLGGTVEATLKLDGE